ncbi:MAG: hypothetical protein KGL35_29735 [Bradyrhizobium sp.]|nr:hypothetical protein [Bradyrhizobium sp.]
MSASASEISAASIEVQMSASRAESQIVAGKAVDWSEFDAAIEAFKATADVKDFVSE